MVSSLYCLYVCSIIRAFIYIKKDVMQRIMNFGVLWEFYSILFVLSAYCKDNVLFLQVTTARPTLITVAVRAEGETNLSEEGNFI